MHMGDTAFRFGTVGTPESTPNKLRGSEGTIVHLAGQDLYAFEIGWVRSVRVSEKTCARIRETAAENDVALSVHAPYYINLNADDEEWPKSRKRLMDAAHYGFLAGATDIVFHPGSYFERPPAEVLEIAIPRLQGCVSELREAGDEVTLRPETMGKGAMLGSLEDTLAMSVEIDGVEPCLDFSHLHARTGDGSMNSRSEWDQVLELYADALGGEALKRLHCHLSGIEYTEKGEQNHLLLADSDIDLEALVGALVDHGCAGRIVCESPGKQDEDAHVIRKAMQSYAAG
jgi:deoxyribonuclease-4